MKETGASSAFIGASGCTWLQSHSGVMLRPGAGPGRTKNGTLGQTALFSMRAWKFSLRDAITPDNKRKMPLKIVHVAILAFHNGRCVT